MSLQVGGITFDLRVRGPRPVRIDDAVELYSRSGRDGQMVKIQGRRGPVAEWILLKFEATRAAADTFIDNTRRALQGTIVQIIYEDGRTQDGVLVERIEQERETQQALQSEAGTPRFEARLSLSLRITSDP